MLIKEILLFEAGLYISVRNQRVIKETGY